MNRYIAPWLAAAAIGGAIALAPIASADTIPTSRIDEFFQLNDIMNVELNKALIGGQDAKTACANIQKQWEDLLRKAGHLALS